MNGKGLIVATIGVGVGLGGPILNGQRSASRDISESCSYVHGEIAAVRSDIAELPERMARLERLFEGHVAGEQESGHDLKRYATICPA